MYWSPPIGGDILILLADGLATPLDLDAACLPGQPFGSRMHCQGMTLAQIVQSHNIMTVLHQLLCHDAADVPGRARN
jgi:hypothetical protein